MNIGEQVASAVGKRKRHGTYNWYFVGGKQGVSRTKKANNFTIPGPFSVKLCDGDVL